MKYESNNKNCEKIDNFFNSSFITYGKSLYPRVPKTVHWKDYFEVNNKLSREGFNQYLKYV